MKVLHVADAYHPAHYWGGPIHSLHGLCKALARIPGVHLHVITTNSAGPGWNDNLIVRENPTRFSDGFDALYCHRIAGRSIAPRLVAEIRRVLPDADVVHLTGVYSFPTIPTIALCALHRKPIVWSPRGALQRWHGSTRRLPKWLWERLCDALLAPSRSVLHLTSEAELKEASRRIRNAQAVVIPNGVDRPSTPSVDRLWMPDGLLRVLYLGRLDAKKGIENLLRAARQLDDLSLTVDIYGTGARHYVNTLRSLAQKLGLEPKVCFRGHVQGKEKEAAFRNADVCVVPSHTENFAMVVAEALAHGVPVIASTGTPWRGLSDKGCGLWVKNDPTSLAEALRSIRRLDLRHMGEQGRTWMAGSYAWNEIAHAMHQVYVRLTAAIT